MADNTSDKILHQIAQGIASLNAGSAPIIFADNVPVYGHVGGIITVTLAAERPHGNEIVIAPTAHLRLTPKAAKLLAESILKAFAMGERKDAAVN